MTLPTFSSHVPIFCWYFEAFQMDCMVCLIGVGWLLDMFEYVIWYARTSPWWQLSISGWAMTKVCFIVFIDIFNAWNGKNEEMNVKWLTVRFKWKNMVFTNVEWFICQKCKVNHNWLGVLFGNSPSSWTLYLVHNQYLLIVMELWSFPNVQDTPRIIITRPFRRQPWLR